MRKTLGKGRKRTSQAKCAAYAILVNTERRLQVTGYRLQATGYSQSVSLADLVSEGLLGAGVLARKRDAHPLYIL